MKADALLVERARKGERQAFSELVELHQRVVLRLALRMTRSLDVAEDIVQESFIKAYLKLHTFEGRSSFRSWLFQITANTAKNKLRERERDFLDVDQMSIAVDAEAEDNMIHDDLKAFIKTEVDKLPSKQRMALSLRIFEDLSFKEIATIMNCPYDTAKANFRHALMKLRHRFAGHIKNSELKEQAAGAALIEDYHLTAEVKG